MAGEHDEAVVPVAPPGPSGAARSAKASPPVTDESGFISLPPGMADFDSATYRIETPRRSEPVVHSGPPVFVPTVPGLPVAVPAAAVEEEIDDSTRVAPAKTEVDDATVVAPTRRVVWTLHLPDAEPRKLSRGTLLLGRGPAALPNWEGAELVPVVDPKKSVSKTHAALEVDAVGRFRVHDLDSTNGVWLSYANGDEVDVEPGAPSVVEDGATIHLGEFAFLVQRA